MNKDQIEEALNYIAQCFPGVEMVNKDDAFSSFSPNELAEFITQYLESKREEIERKAYEAGFKYGKEYGEDISYIKRRNSLKDPIIKTYDQWKEQKQKQ